MPICLKICLKIYLFVFVFIVDSRYIYTVPMVNCEHVLRAASHAIQRVSAVRESRTARTRLIKCLCSAYEEAGHFFPNVYNRPHDE